MVDRNCGKVIGLYVIALRNKIKILNNHKNINEKQNKIKFGINELKIGKLKAERSIRKLKQLSSQELIIAQI